MLKNLRSKVAVVATTCLAVATSSFAAIDPADLTLIQSGISGADATYYAIGGSILVVLAGVWGFKMVKRLF